MAIEALMQAADCEKWHERRNAFYHDVAADFEKSCRYLTAGYYNCNAHRLRLCFYGTRRL